MLPNYLPVNQPVLTFFKPKYAVSLLLLLLFSVVNITAQTKPATPAEMGNHRAIINRFFEQQAKVQYIYQVHLNREGNAIVWCADNPKGNQVIRRMALNKKDSAVAVSAAVGNESGNECEPQWSPDGKEIAFLSDVRSRGQLQVFLVNAITGKLVQESPLTQLEGYVSHLKWSPDGQYLSVLYVEKASREPSPMAAENRAVGLIDSILNRDVQRIAVINRNNRKMNLVTPAGLYIFEYDWSPDSKQLAYTAAQPPGDDNWYIAQLYKQALFSADTQLLYKPVRQIAVPRWSPDGKKLAFIEGLMSDQGGTGGEIFTVSSTGGGKPENLTPNRPSSPSWFAWQPGGNMVFNEFTGGSVAINSLNTSTKTVKNLWKGDYSVRAGAEEMSLSVAGSASNPVIAFTASAWSKLPEVYGGQINKLEQLTHLNSAMNISLPEAKNIEWTSENFKVQGWLLYPSNYDSAKQYPMLVCVHGGPAWITTPTWSAPDFNTTVYTQLGYFVFFPNARGSHGQGEEFTLANRRDWGFGDLRDIISGTDAVLKNFPVDSSRVGILGWSYGGFMSMFAITQTNKFKAAVSGAGAGDWLSYYGQNRIDKWMDSYFGASPYDDPAAYAKSSAMTYIKKAATPILLLVGERDGEAPAPQSFQYWHALKELRVPTQLMVYADEGHSFSEQKNRIDVCIRTIEWFNKYLAPENKK